MLAPSMPEHATHHAAHHAADEGRAAIRAAAMVGATTATAATAAAGRVARRMIVGLLARRGLVGGDDLGEKRLVLQLVEIARDRIAARGLPALDDRAGVLVELAVDLGVEAEPGEPALHVAALALVETDLVLGDLARLVGEGRRVYAGGHVAGRGRRAVLQGRDPRQRQRLELAVGIAG